MSRLSSLFPKHNSRSNVSSHTVGQKTNVQDDIPTEIRRNNLCLESLKDVNNLVGTSVGSNAQAAYSQPVTLNLGRLIDEPSELGKTRNIDQLIKQLTKSAVRGADPPGFYIREIQYLAPKNWRTIKDKQLCAVLNACKNLQVIKFASPFGKHLDWPEILKTKKKLQSLYLADTMLCLHRFSFWSLLETLTTTSPDIETLKLNIMLYSYSQMPLVGPDAATVAKASRTHSPCRKLKTISSEDEVWTIPYLKYLTVMAPYLVEAHLFLWREDNLTELNSTLEASLTAWSMSLKTLYICHCHANMSDSEIRRRQSYPLTFPKMERLEVLALIGVQISTASLYNLNSLENLALAYIDHKRIVAALGSGHGRPVLDNLTALVVDCPEYYYRGMIGRRNNVELYQWDGSCLLAGRLPGYIHWKNMVGPRYQR